VTLPRDIGALVRKIGTVDILVNNAGVLESAPFIAPTSRPGGA